MKHAAWLTDLHLEFVREREVFDTFCQRVIRETPDFVLVGGDTAVAGSVVQKLQDLEAAFAVPIYFVLGNHDFYYGSFEPVRAKVRELARDSAKLCWLTEAGVVELTPKTALIGHDTWADGRLGNADQSQVRLNDYLVIRDFENMSQADRFRKLNHLGDEAAEYIQQALSRALQSHDEVIMLTHVPPFEEACLHQGKISNGEYLPHFSCKAVGDVTRDLMQAHPEKRLTVLCGHTHSAAHTMILPNLEVRAGSATYREPELQANIEIP